MAALKKFAEAKDPGASEYQDALMHLKKLFDASVAFAKTLMGVDFPDEDDFVQRFYDVAATDYLRVHHPGFYWGIQPFVYATELALQQGAIDVPGPGGLREIVITDLPNQVLPNSLFAESGDGAQVRSVLFRERAVSQDIREEVRKLDEEIRALTDAMAANQRALQTASGRAFPCSTSARSSRSTPAVRTGSW